MEAPATGARERSRGSGGRGAARPGRVRDHATSAFAGLGALVASGAVLAKDLAPLKTVELVQGGELPVDVRRGPKVGGAAVETPDLAAANGVMHASDTVVPPS